MREVVIVTVGLAWAFLIFNAYTSGGAMQCAIRMRTATFIFLYRLWLSVVFAGSGKCPKCGSESKTAKVFHAQRFFAHYHLQCNQCHNRWRYRL